ncbi:hypothetical protein E4U41_005383 [Claviceps citrina]|nr:hypothetical protein E4U41_005383 [Claviceps citrina]
MKFSAASILGAFSAASPELNAMVNVLGQVRQQLANLDAVIQESGPAVAPIVEACLLIVSTIKSGTYTISALGKLGLGSSIRLIGPVSELKSHSQATSDRLVGLRPQIERQGNTDIVHLHVTHIKEATQSFVSTMLGKVPSEAQGIARQQAQGIVDILGHLQKSFSSDQ